MKDERCLCHSCMNDYILAGYRVNITNNKELGVCDKCARPGFDYIIESPFERRKKDVYTKRPRD